MTVSPAPGLTPVPGFSFDQLASLQSSCSSVQSLLNSGSLKIISIPYGTIEVKCDVSTGVPRPLVPFSLRRKLFNLLHSTTFSSKLILRLFLRMPLFLPSLLCTEILLKFWNNKINSDSDHQRVVEKPDSQTSDSH